LTAERPLAGVTRAKEKLSEHIQQRPGHHLLLTLKAKTTAASCRADALNSGKSFKQVLLKVQVFDSAKGIARD
jgi:hypothetical protein